MNAKPPAKNAPTIHEKIIGNPNPPRKPVFAGLISSIASMPGSAVNLINRIPEIIRAAMLYVLKFDFWKFFKMKRNKNTNATIIHIHIKIFRPPALHASWTGSTEIITAANPPRAV